LSPTRDLVIGLDPDAMKEAIEIAMQMVHFKRIKLLRLPENKDINDIGKTQTLALEKSSEYLRYTDLLKLKNNINGKGTEFTYQRVRPNYSATRGVS
jgi:hypothetical protein